MDQPLLLKKISDHYSNQLPFVAYVLPESEELVVFLQKDDVLHTDEQFTEPGFIMAPFDFNGTAYLIPNRSSEILKTPVLLNKTSRSSIPLDNDSKDKETYEFLVSEALQRIGKGKARKIVVSRNKGFQLRSVDLTEIIDRLINLYPGAFRYVWYHPSHGLWCGATPEILVHTEKDSFTTMALAGTQQYIPNQETYWSAKEIEEQQIVTDAITNSLQRIAQVLKVSKTRTYKAGSLVHLRTDITGILKNVTTTLAKIIMVLHPTPAVCGSPREEVKRFLNEKEHYSRQFYTGFLGPVCQEENTSNIFVNLRCMSIDEKVATLYVGGGITAASIPDKEWEETQNKMQTMLQVIAPML